MVERVGSCEERPGKPFFRDNVCTYASELENTSGKLSRCAPQHGPAAEVTSLATSISVIASWSHERTIAPAGSEQAINEQARTT
jgi:hypothetical protein